MADDQHLEETLKRIGEKLRELRIKKGYSNYEQFAWDHDIGRMQYWRMEKGEYNMTIKSLLKVLQAHGMGLEEFFGGMNGK